MDSSASIGDLSRGRSSCKCVPLISSVTLSPAPLSWSFLALNQANSANTVLNPLFYPTQLPFTIDQSSFTGCGQESFVPAW